MEVEAVDEGTLGKIVIAEGSEGVPVNAVIGLLLEDGEDASALEGFKADAAASRPQPRRRRRRSRLRRRACRGAAAAGAGRAHAAKPTARAGNGADHGADLREPARQADGCAGRPRPRSAPGQRAAWPDRQGGHRAGAAGGSAGRGAGRARGARAPRAEAPAAPPPRQPARGPAPPAAAYHRAAAVQHAQGDRAPADRGQADHPALLPDAWTARWTRCSSCARS